jgi:hypothetical protein
VRLSEAEFARRVTAVLHGRDGWAAALLAVTAVVLAGALVYAAVPRAVRIGAIVVLAVNLVGAMLPGGGSTRRSTLTFAASRRALASVFRARSS